MRQINLRPGWGLQRRFGREIGLWLTVGLEIGLGSGMDGGGAVT